MLPREKLEAQGSKVLSDQELLSAIIGTGSKKINISQLSQKVLQIIEEKNGKLSLEDLQRVEGVGKAKACQIFASLEFGRRRNCSYGKKITSAGDILPYLISYATKKQEHFVCISLNGAHEIIEIRVVSIGLVNSTQVHPREVFADPLTDRACAVIVAHNHPSGSLEPSNEDLLVTKRLDDAAKLLGIRLLDHVIFSRNGHYSFAESGRL